MKTERYICDIKNCNNIVAEHSDDKKVKIRMQVIFATEQTEGRKTEPYFDYVDMDICQQCLSKILKSGLYIIAYGAQGFNEYQLRK